MRDDEDELRDEVAAAREANALRSMRPVRPFESESEEREVPCLKCKKPVVLSGVGWDAARAASVVLISRGESPLRNDEMTRCPECAKARYEARGRKFEELMGKVNQAQRDAKETGRTDHTMLSWLKANGMKTWAEGIESAAERWRSKGTATKPSRSKL